ncbi:MAG: hypothetical protein R2727_08875 [Bacteroidales bacterium]
MRKTFIALLLLTILQLTSFAQPVSKSDLEDLDRYYTRISRDWNIPGFTVAIVKDGEMVFSKGYGVKEIGKKGARTVIPYTQSPPIQSLYISHYCNAGPGRET